MKVKKHTQKILILLTSVFFSTFLFANDIQISNILLTGQNTASDFTMIQFDVSWKNSWRTSTLENNFDATWIFAKYRRKADNVWYSAFLNDVGHTTPVGSVISPGLINTDLAFNPVTNPAIGCFIYRDADGIGDVNYTGVQLQWNYGANSLADYDSVEICVYAIEMVNIPQGAFYLGDNASSSVGHFVAGTTATTNFQVTSENLLTVANTATSELWGTSTSGVSTIGPVGTLPAVFPKGFGSYYIMKYELSQYMYKEYLNKLTRTQQVARVSATTVGRFMRDANTYNTPQYRNGIKVMSDAGGCFTSSLWK